MDGREWVEWVRRESTIDTFGLHWMDVAASASDSLLDKLCASDRKLAQRYRDGKWPWDKYDYRVMPDAVREIHKTMYQNWQNSDEIGAMTSSAHTLIDAIDKAEGVGEGLKAIGEIFNIVSIDDG